MSCKMEGALSGKGGVQRPRSAVKARRRRGTDPVRAQLPWHLFPRTLAMAKRRLRLRALEVRSDGRWEGQLRLADCSRRSVHGHIGGHASAHNLPSHGIARLDDTHPELALD